MTLALFRRFGFALWLGIIALVGNVFTQNQLTVSVLSAAAETQAPAHVHHHPPDCPMGDVAEQGVAEAGAPHKHGGHTHRGHADCELCGAAASVAAFTLEIAYDAPTPAAFELPRQQRAVARLDLAPQPSPYASRAPPGLT